MDSNTPLPLAKKGYLLWTTKCKGNSGRATGQENDREVGDTQVGDNLNKTKYAKMDG